MPKLKDTAEEIFSKEIKKALIDKGWNQQKLAEMLHKTEPQISRFIHHPFSSRFSTVSAICKKIGIKEIKL